MDAGHRRFQWTAGELKEIMVAERTGRPFLVWRAGGGAQELLVLEPERWRVTIGRDPDADVSLEWDREVSRTHAVLERFGRSWAVVDDGFSRNGSFVNKARVRGRQRLADRDCLSFGATELTYRETKPGMGDSTVSVTDTVPSVMLSPTQRKVMIALCRPMHDGRSPTPATNREIATEIFLTVDAVKAHLRVLFERYRVGDVPQNEKRARLAASALVSGDLTASDF